MKKVEVSFANLAVGEVVTLMGMDLANVRFVREKKSEKERKDGLEPLTYYHFSIGGRGFTVDSNDMDSVELLRDKAKRATVAQLTLEATEHQVPVLDDDLQPTGSTDTRKSFRFISVVTTADAVAYVKNAGTLAKEEAAWAPKENTVGMAELGQLINKSVSSAVSSLKDELKAELIAG